MSKFTYTGAYGQYEVSVFEEHNRMNNLKLKIETHSDGMDGLPWNNETIIKGLRFLADELEKPTTTPNLT